MKIYSFMHQKRNKHYVYNVALQHIFLSNLGKCLVLFSSGGEDDCIVPNFQLVFILTILKV